MNKAPGAQQAPGASDLSEPIGRFLILFLVTGLAGVVGPAGMVGRRRLQAASRVMTDLTIVAADQVMRDGWRTFRLVVRAII